MGLDQYAHTTTKKIAGEVDFTVDAGDYQELHYWRKHANLQRWMTDLYLSKGGKDPDFNTSMLLLTSSDLDKLEADMKNGLATATGFFWGESTPEKDEATREFIAAARAAIAEGRSVVYSAWY